MTSASIDAKIIGLQIQECKYIDALHDIQEELQLLRGVRRKSPDVCAQQTRNLVHRFKETKEVEEFCAKTLLAHWTEHHYVHGDGGRHRLVYDWNGKTISAYPDPTDAALWVMDDGEKFIRFGKKDLGKWREAKTAAEHIAVIESFMKGPFRAYLPLFLFSATGALVPEETDYLSDTDDEEDAS